MMIVAITAQAGTALDGVYEELSLSYPSGVLWSYSGGIPTGEVTRLAGSSAYDQMTDLDYRASTGVWYSWTAQYKALDENPSYHWHKVAGDHFEIHTPKAQHAN